MKSYISSHKAKIISGIIVGFILFWLIAGYNIDTPIFSSSSEWEKWANGNVYYTFYLSFWKVSIDFLINFR